MSKVSESRQSRRKTFVATVKSIMQPQRLGDLLISRGKLTQGDLHYALVRQKSGQTARLGRILIEQRLVSRSALYQTLAHQWTMRCLAATLTFMISFGGGIHAARAGTIEDVPGQASLVGTANGAFSPMHSYPSLFGTEEKESTNITPFLKWTSMFQHFQSDLHNPKYRTVVQNWESNLRPLRGLPLPQMAQRVNDLMNAHEYVEDSVNWGVSDYWADPIEFLTRNGDCEDFAIAKYASLRMLGVPEDHLRLAIVKDLQKGVAHAILILYTNNGDALVLDNQNKEVRSASNIARYQPIYSINQHGWWLHRAPSATILASAQ